MIIGLRILGSVLLEFIQWFSIICIIGIVAITYLLIMDVISIEDIKDFFNKDGRNK